jgi:hypothetical protein
MEMGTRIPVHGVYEGHAAGFETVLSLVAFCFIQGIICPE